jgi:uncharacterized repeat protein (TIGR01451 family)
MKLNVHARRALSWCAIALALVAIERAWAHNVGQVQTTKFLAPETVRLLKSRFGAASQGFAVGDEVSYIIQFSPVAVGANIGVAGYITDYIPPGTVVVGAAIVAKDGAGDFYNVPPSFPGGIDNGWGNRGLKNFGSPFNTHAYDTTGRCATTLVGGNAIPANRCTGRLSELHADTGIFYSTDPRTAAFPALPIRIEQGINGYAISPTREGDLNSILNQTRATTHNLWDADQVSAFSQLPAGITPSSTLRISTATFVSSDGAVPYNAGSAVAGLGAGYQLDNTGAVGPWNRIAYTGSRMGDNSTGPAIDAAGGNALAVSGFPTSAGYNLSSSNPLPAGTNAVRWAVGQLTVGEVRYVKITLRLTAPVPIGGLMNSSEVFGGDAGGADDGKDNVWRYHVPSVADNNSNLFVEKSVKCVFDDGGICQPSNGGYIVADARVRYQITYFNAGAVPQTNVVLQDILPCHTGNNASTVTSIVSGSITFPAVNPPVTTAGNCGSGRSTVTFPTLGSLAAGVGGSVEIDVQTNAGNNALVVNTAKLSSQQLPGGVTSNANSTVQTVPNLVISKTATTPQVSPGGTVSYSIVVENVGAANANGIVVYDILPSLGGANTATTRFSYSSTASITVSSSSTLTLPPVVATSIPPTLVPYNGLPTASNSQQVSWSFGTSSLIPGGKFTLTFTVNVGASVSASVTPYYNNTAVTYTNGGAGRADAASAAPVLVTSPLSVTKTIDCYFVGADCKKINASNQIPPGAKIRYQIDYANTGGTTITNAVLSDTLPCQVSSGAVSNIQIVGGPIPLPSPNPPGNSAGVCPGTRPIASFPATTLAAGQTGSVKLDVQTNAVVGNLVVNTAGLTASGTPPASSEVQATVAAQPSLSITKTAGVGFVRPGTTLSYTITVTNVGTTAAQTITVYDWLPTTSAVNSPATRFSYTGTSAIIGLSPVTPVVNIPPSLPPYNSTTTNPYSNNQEEVKWDFGSQILAPGSSFSITFNALAGASIPTSTTTTYNNFARVYFDGNATNSGPASASVALIANLTIAKSNGTTTLTAGSATRYTVTVSNLGPSAAGGAVVKDTAGAGLLCTAVTCAATTGTATCPAALPVGTSVNAGSTAFFTTGEAIPSLPANSSVVFAVDCGVVTTGL